MNDKKRGAATSVLRTGACAAALLVAALALGCSNPAGTPPNSTAYTSFLYMTDTTNGHVYTYAPGASNGSSLSLVTTAPAAGEIKFYKGIGYVAVGYYSGAGVYYFDPSSTAPSAKLIAGSAGLYAQYFAFYSPTQAYVSVVSGSSGAVYTFNPSNLASTPVVPVSGTSGYIQEVIVGPDGMIYAADNSANKVLKINPATNTVLTTISANASGTTGLFSGTYNSNPGVFVANTGGSIDFIPEGAATGSTAALVTSSSIYPGRLVQLSNGNLVATGYDTNYAYHTYLVALSGTSAGVSEIKAGTTSFGGLSIAYNSSSGLVYVPYTTYSPTTNQLYVFDASGTQQSYSPVTVMKTSDNIANVAFYQN
jgi:hypothetical protein